jgi:hypothetical protein
VLGVRDGKGPDEWVDEGEDAEALQAELGSELASEL